MGTIAIAAAFRPRAAIIAAEVFAGTVLALRAIAWRPIALRPGRLGGRTGGRRGGGGFGLGLRRGSGRGRLRLGGGLGGAFRVLLAAAGVLLLGPVSVFLAALLGLTLLLGARGFHHALACAKLFGREVEVRASG